MPIGALDLSGYCNGYRATVAVICNILDTLNWRSSELLSELDQLAALDIYSKYDPSKLDIFLNSDVSALASILEENAPRTLHLLRLLSQPHAI
jgi:hypothetical protein